MFSWAALLSLRQVGFRSDVHWITAPPPRPSLSPVTEKTNKTPIPLLRPGVDLSWDPHRKKAKTKACFMILGKGGRERARESERERSRLARCLFYKQTNKQNPTGKHAIKAELCGKDKPDVDSWRRVEMRPHCSVF